MMNGILSPAFLQAAGRAGKSKFNGLILMSNADDPSISSVSCDGEMTVKTTKNGVEHIDTYSDLEGETLAISADKNTEIYISGNLIGNWEIGRNANFVSIKCTNTALTELNCNSCYALQELDLSANAALTELYCYGCNALQKLNLSTNTTLTQLSCTNCFKINTIYYPATNGSVSSAIAGAISNSEADDGTVYTDSQGAEYSTIATAATAKGWTIEQLS